MINKLFHNNVAKNASWLIVSKIFQMVLGFLVGIMSARYLGPSNYGVINYAAAYTAFFTSLCTLGINSVIIKEFVDNKNKEGRVIGTALGLRAISSILSAIIIVCISCFIDKGEMTTILVVALSSIGTIFYIFEIFAYWFQARLESKKMAIASLIAYSVTTIYKFVLLVTSKPVLYFAAATSVDYICIAIILIFFYIRADGPPISFSLTYAKKLLQKSCHFILPGMLVAIYGQTDKLMLKHMISEAEIGYYATASGLCNMWCFVLNAIIDSMTPIIMQAYNENRDRFERLNRVLYCIIIYVSVFVSLIFMIFGSFIIGVLYGEAYLPALTPLKVITWYTAFSYLGVARTAWLVCENKQKYLLRIYASAALSNIILNIMLIPQMGATGAAIASLIAQIITTMITPFFVKDMRRNSIMMVEAMLFKNIKGD